MANKLCGLGWRLGNYMLLNLDPMASFPTELSVGQTRASQAAWHKLQERKYFIAVWYIRTKPKLITSFILKVSKSFEIWYLLTFLESRVLTIMKANRRTMFFIFIIFNGLSLVVSKRRCPPVGLNNTFRLLQQPCACARADQPRNPVLQPVVARQNRIGKVQPHQLQHS